MLNVFFHDILFLRVKQKNRFKWPHPFSNNNIILAIISKDKKNILYERLRVLKNVSELLVDSQPTENIFLMFSKIVN